MKVTCTGLSFEEDFIDQKRLRGKKRQIFRFSFTDDRYMTTCIEGEHQSSYELGREYNVIVVPAHEKAKKPKHLKLLKT